MHEQEDALWLAAATTVHIRSYKPLSVSFPAPGVYQRVRLVLPDLEPSVLSRISQKNGNAPLSVILDFDQEFVTAKEVLNFITQNLSGLDEVSKSTSMPIHRSLYNRLRLTKRHDHGAKHALVPAENPLESVYEEDDEDHEPDEDEET